MDEVPAQLRLVEEFANTVDVEAGEDQLASLDRFEQWLAGNGYRGVTPTADDLELATHVRAALRDELVAHHDRLPDVRARLDDYAAEFPLQAFFGGGRAALVPVDEGVRGMLGEVFAAIVLAERDGVWHRLKLCREDSCQWVFYDRSKNQSKTWCSMRVCGNRNKTRSYRSRQRPGE